MKEERIDDQDVASLVEGTDDAPNERVGEIHACDGFTGGSARAKERVGDSSRLERGKTELREVGVQEAGKIIISHSLVSRQTRERKEIKAQARKQAQGRRARLKKFKRQTLCKMCEKASREGFRGLAA